MNPSKRKPKRSGRTKLGDQRHAPAGIAGYRGPVAPDEPPAIVPCLFRNIGEQPSRLLIGQGE